MFGAILLQGCTVGWYSLRWEQNSSLSNKSNAWACPTNYEIEVKSSHYTNTFGEKNARTEHLAKVQNELNAATVAVLTELGCNLDGSEIMDQSYSLKITVTEQNFASALPQEWLTGLSLGLIPSWGTRPDRWKFQFSLGENSQAFYVDDTRFNHIIAFPVFWLTFPLMNVESEYKASLRDFAKNAIQF